MDTEWGQKWLIKSSYNPFKVFIGDISVGMENETMKDFCNF